MNVGFIGLGRMGRAMANNLERAGHQVRGWNRTRGPAEAPSTDRFSIVATPDNAFAGDAVVSMLADDAAVRAVFLQSGLLSRAPASTIHVNMATISVELAEELTEEHRRHNIVYVAAPVLGRPDAAAAGKLTIVAAGPGVALAKVHPLFDAIGSHTWLVGDTPSHANLIKLAANLLLTSAIETLAEAAVLLSAYGMNADTLFDILSGSTFPGPVYGTYGRLIADARYEPAGFKAALALKDVRLALAAADTRSVPLPVATVVKDSLLEAYAHGDGEKDAAVLGDLAARRAGRA